MNLEQVSKTGNQIKTNDRYVYTDGGCHNNGQYKGIGSFAYVILDDIHDVHNDKVTVFGGLVTDTTNNITEMMAVIHAIKHIQNFMYSNTAINIFSDSAYVVNGFCHPSYLDKWKTNGWKNSDRKTVANIDLWKELDRLSWHSILRFKLIKGHGKDNDPINIHWNNIVDMACTFLITKYILSGKQSDTCVMTYNSHNGFEINYEYNGGI